MRLQEVIFGLCLHCECEHLRNLRLLAITPCSASARSVHPSRDRCFRAWWPAESDTTPNMAPDRCLACAQKCDKEWQKVDTQTFNPGLVLTQRVVPVMFSHCSRLYLSTVFRTCVIVCPVHVIQVWSFIFYFPHSISLCRHKCNKTNQIQ